MTEQIIADTAESIRQLSTDAGLRYASIARILSVSGATISRWVAEDPTQPDPSSAAIVRERIGKLYAEDSRTGLFRTIHELNQKEKTRVLIGVLYKENP